MTRSIALIAGLFACAAVLAGAAFALTGERAPEPAPSRSDPLLRSGAARYGAYLRAEAASLASARRTGDAVAIRLHEGRLAPAGGRAREVDPVAAVRAASRLLSLDGRRAGEADLLGVEARIAGAAIAFDAIRDALWARDQGLTGSIDERLAGLRAELERHRRRGRYAAPASLRTADRRRLAAALDAYAWRLSLAADRVAAR